MVADASQLRTELQAKPMKRPYMSLQHHDAAAWDEFYNEHVRDLYGFVFGLSDGDPQIAADVFQDTWLDAIRHIAQFDPAGESRVAGFLRLRDAESRCTGGGN